MLYYKNFEDFESAEDFRHYLKENTGIDLGKDRRVSSDPDYYEFETYGYPGFVMNMVYEIWFAGGIEYAEIGHLPQARKEKYLESEQYLWNSGFDPKGLPNFLSRIKDQNILDRPNEFWHSLNHPPLGMRQKRILGVLRILPELPVVRINSSVFIGFQDKLRSAFNRLPHK